mmetsp:Transcript_34148/g.72635  ORF Transcript_34148/g.72635 Transcript_34148/m.72635 type:complete len:127 (-) Transcript_34148:464-844(-)
MNVDPIEAMQSTGLALNPLDYDSQFVEAARHLVHFLLGWRGVDVDPLTNVLLGYLRPERPPSFLFHFVGPDWTKVIWLFSPLQSLYCNGKKQRKPMKKTPLGMYKLFNDAIVAAIAMLLDGCIEEA